MSTLIAVENLSIVARHAGGEKPILHDISFTVAEGEMLALIGESGSGKTTLALALMGYLRPGCRVAAGRITVAGYELTAMSEAEKRRYRGRVASYVAQNAASAFNPAVPLMRQVVEPARVHHLLAAGERERRAQALFADLGLPEPQSIGQRHVGELSGGQLQRLMAAMALITEPEVLIFDEPTTALDVTTQIGVLAAFRAAMAKRGVTGVYVTHDLAVVAQMAGRAVVLKDGTLRETGRVRDLFAAPRDDYTRALLAAAEPKLRRGGMVACSVRPALEVRDLVVGYGRRDAEGVPAKVVVDRVSFAVPPGSILGVIGESGCGKSTLARAIAGLQPWTTGSVRLDGAALSASVEARTPAQKRQVQMVAQNADAVLNPARRVGATLERVVRFYDRLDAASARRRVGELLEMVRLPAELTARFPGELSGGQRQRVNFARALAATPNVLLCDEITAPLDTVVAEAILDLMTSLQRELKLACIFITHDLRALQSVCDRVAVLHAGRVVEFGPTRGLDRDAHHPYTELLRDSLPEMDPGWLDAVLARGAQRAEPAAAPTDPALCRFLPRCPTPRAGVCDTLPPPMRIAPSGARLLCHLNPGTHT